MHRFIFSHSALREGWDNPNVFVICALKHSDNTVSRRVKRSGCGLHASPSIRTATAWTIRPPCIISNVLTVVANESYKEISSPPCSRIYAMRSPRDPGKADEDYFQRQGPQDGRRRCEGDAGNGEGNLLAIW